MSDAEDTSIPERRSDGATRAIVSRLDKLEARLSSVETEMTSMNARQDSNVTFKGILVGAASILALIFGAFGVVVSRAEAASKEAGHSALLVAQEAKSEAHDTASFLRTELQDFRREMKADIGDLKSELRNTATSVRRDVKRATVVQDGSP